MLRVTRDEFLEAVKAQLNLEPDEPMENLTPRQLAKILEMARAIVRGPDKYMPGELEIPCPICEAPPGEECRTRPGSKGTWMPGPHPQRRMASAEERMKRAVEGI